MGFSILVGGAGLTRAVSVLYCPPEVLPQQSARPWAWLVTSLWRRWLRGALVVHSEGVPSDGEGTGGFGAADFPHVVPLGRGDVEQNVLALL